MDKIAVLIPCCNEEKTIEKVIKDIKKELPDCVIYVYDNNSHDKTAEISQNTGVIVKHEYLQGKANVIRRMLRDIDAECYIMIDGDDTYPAKYVKEMADLILNSNVDMVIGDRLSSTYFSENKRPFHSIGNKLVRNCINFLFNSNIKDVMTGYRGFSYEFAKTFPILSQGFEIETEMTIHAIDKNMYIENMVVEYRTRTENSMSKLNTYSDGIKVIKTIIKLYRIYKPMYFFCTISLIFALISIIFFFFSFKETVFVYKTPAMLVCCFTMIIAIESFFAGLHLNTIIEIKRQDFEANLKNVRTIKVLLDKLSKCK